MNTNPIRPRTRLFRSLCVSSCVLVANSAVPLGLINEISSPFQPGRSPAPAKSHDAAKKAPAFSRPLLASEQRKLVGAMGENPYIAGNQKCDVIYKGIDVVTGNYTTSATDMSFETGYGIAVNVSRSYASNDADDGPFGKGWTLSADMQSTATGTMKSPAAPIKSIPVGFMERPSAQLDDPNAETNTGANVQPPEAVIASDASGNNEIVQKDVDGILTPPPYDTNVINSTYEYRTLNGATYQVLLTNTLQTTDGTVYQYTKHGIYPNGEQPWNNTTVAPQAANVLKVDTATDRSGNVTAYYYSNESLTGSTFSGAQYQKSDGLVWEQRLLMVIMPPQPGPTAPVPLALPAQGTQILGHAITFNWGTYAVQGLPYSEYRITSVVDNGTPSPRTVTYSYNNSTGNNPNYILSGETSPGGKQTLYGYGSSVYVPNPVNSGTAYNLLTSITNPQGLATQIAYYVENTYILPYNAYMQGVRAYQLTQPNGSYTTVLPWVAEYNNQGLPAGVNLNNMDDDGLVGSIIDVRDTDTAGNTQNNNSLVQDPGFTVIWGVSGTSLSVYVYPYQGYHGMTGYSDKVPTTINTYNTQTLQLTQSETEILNSDTQIGLPSYPNRFWPQPAWAGEATITNTSYNFMGNPLEQSVTEQYWTVIADYRWYTHTPNITREAVSQWAYWGQSKYFQQMAALDPSGRISFTDYYASGTPGAGQVYRQYAPSNNAVGINTTPYSQGGPYVPAGTPAAEAWRYQIYLLHPNAYETQYICSTDPHGRITEVDKLGPAGTYIATTSTYGADGAPAWGQATDVFEDATSSSPRHTQNKAYMSWGKPSDVIDGAGHEFVTSYDPDELVLSMTRTDVSPHQTLVSYTYGQTPPTQAQPISVTYGRVVQVVDNLTGVTYGTGVTDAIGYQTSGPGLGEIASITESGGGLPTYTVSYTFDTNGNRQTSTYATTNSSTSWGYYDYVYRGDPTNPSPAFQTMALLSGGNRTSEEFHYDIDSGGRLLNAAFAQTPTQTAPINGSWYYTYGGTENAAASRARASYDFDAAGRPLTVQHYWENGGTSGTTNYNTIEAILANVCTYEQQIETSEFTPTIPNTQAMNRGVKVNSATWNRLTAGQPTWHLERTDTYGYDPQLDYLISANYGDLITPDSATWSYDPAGNRQDSTVDDLNRTTAVGGVTAGCDVLGNRLKLGSNTYTWDCLNRLASYDSNTYEYRADGMRVGKVVGSTTTVYRYDGQMGIEDVDTTGTAVTVNDYALGERNIDEILTNSGSGTTTSYPIYDAHGNMVSTVSKGTQSGTYTTAPERDYDAWGVIRPLNQNQTGNPKGRYCANLGHKQDDESGLIYMRARYYEPTSGRFLSEDPAYQGNNWFVYADNEPVSHVDQSGKNPWWVGVLFLVGFTVGAAALDNAITIAYYVPPFPGKVAAITTALNLAVGGLALAFAMTGTGSKIGPAGVAGLTAMVIAMGPVIGQIAQGMSTAQQDGLAAGVVIGLSVYSTILLAFVIDAALGDDLGS